MKGLRLNNWGKIKTNSGITGLRPIYQDLGVKGLQWLNFFFLNWNANIFVFTVDFNDWSPTLDKMASSQRNKQNGDWRNECYALSDHKQTISYTANTFISRNSGWENKEVCCGWSAADDYCFQTSHVDTQILEFLKSRQKQCCFTDEKSNSYAWATYFKMQNF